MSAYELRNHIREVHGEDLRGWNYERLMAFHVLVDLGCAGFGSMAEAVEAVQSLSVEKATEPSAQGVLF